MSDMIVHAGWVEVVKWAMVRGPCVPGLPGNWGEEQGSLRGIRACAGWVRGPW